jgi:hypothetical protein
MLVENIPVLETCSPNKLFDALAAGRPLIINIYGWMKELLEHNEVGLVAVPGSGKSLAEKMLRLRDDATLRERMGRNARQLAEQQFDRIKLARQFECVLANAVGIDPPPFRDEQPTLQRAARSGSTALPPSSTSGSVSSSSRVSV